MSDPIDYSRPTSNPDFSRPGAPSPYSRDSVHQYGTASKLQALSDGYFGLNWVFLINVVLVISIRALSVVSSTPENAVMMTLIFVAVVFVVIAALSFPQNKKIGYGANWSESMPLIASLLMGLNSALCCGLIGYVVVQHQALKEMRRYGIAAGFLGLNKSNVNATISQLRQAERAASPGERF